MFLKALISRSSQEEIHKYAEVFIEEFKVNNYNKLNAWLNMIYNKDNKFEYIIDTKLSGIDYDYTNIIHIISKVLDDKFLLCKQTKVRFLYDNGFITCIFRIKSDEISHRRFRRIIGENIKDIYILKKYTIAYLSGYSVFTLNIDK